MSDFKHTVRIYWEDTDAGGIVYYANYLKFFERARTEWLRTLGIHQKNMREEHNALFVVSEIHVKYQHPARLDDQLFVTSKVKQIGRASLTLTQQALRNDVTNQILCEAEVKLACLNATTLTTSRFPKPLATALTTA